jgi:hypothetical protein
MPRVSRGRVGTVLKVHIKFVSMAPKTLIKYKVAVRRFLWWRKSAGFPYPSAVTDFDFQVSEFINHLYLDDSPLGWATDCISGLKRLFPRCRRHLDTASLYHANWVKATKRVKALPLTPELVRGIAAFSLVQGNADFALNCFNNVRRSAPYRRNAAVAFGPFQLPSRQLLHNLSLGV